MDRTEFIYGLRRALADVEDYEFVNDTIAYYENYIDTQIRKGAAEVQVLEELGDPRYIAKSIKASRTADNPSDSHWSADDFGESIDNKRHYVINGNEIAIPRWLDTILRIILAILAVIVVFAVCRVLLPVVFVGIIAMFLYRFIRDNFFGPGT